MHRRIEIVCIFLYCFHAGGQARACTDVHEKCVEEEVLRAKLIATQLQGLVATPKEEKRRDPAEGIQKETVEKQEELLETLRKERLEIDATVKGHFPKPGCFATFWIGGHGTTLLAAVLDSNFEVRAVSRLGLGLDGHPALMGFVENDSLQSLDLDGDGIDEVLGHLGIGHRGFNQDWVSIFRLNDGRIQEVSKFTTHFDNKAEKLGAKTTIFDAKVSVGKAAADGVRPIVVSGRLKSGQLIPDPTFSSIRDITGHAVFRLEEGRIRRTSR